MSGSVASGINPLILGYSHLVHFPRQEEALHMLKRLASLVAPIMRARGWKIGLLSEMYPERPNLLGLNTDRGERIQLRLRPPEDRNQFLAFNFVLDTLLHELAHNVWGTHDHRFNALWEQLREEMEGLQMKGYTGEGFLSQGHKLGGQRIPYHEIHRLARAEAEKRRHHPAAGGYRVGGRAARPGEDIRSIIVESIERRNKTEQGCANRDRTDREIREISETWVKKGFRTKAEEDAANEAAMAQAMWELVQEDEKRKHGNSYIPPSAQNPYHAGPPPFPTRPTPPARPRSPEMKDYWACDLCTLHNPVHAKKCDACGTSRPAVLPRRTTRPEVIDLTESPPRKKPSGSRNTARLGGWSEPPPRPPPRPATWTCSLCSNVMESEWWTCSRCGKMKESS
ncbi:hypothetical protein VTK56DRAFT_1741 [Thermocarpiscus australiensis]